MIRVLGNKFYLCSLSIYFVPEVLLHSYYPFLEILERTGYVMAE